MDQSLSRCSPRAGFGSRSRQSCMIWFYFRVPRASSQLKGLKQAKTSSAECCECVCVCGWGTLDSQEINLN